MKKRVKTSLILFLGIFLLVVIITAKILLTPNSEKILIGVQSIEKLQNETGCINLEDMKEISTCIGEHSTLYVQTGCHFCAQQEEIFGNNYQYLNVIDCFYERNKCQKVTATPTWVINS